MPESKLGELLPEFVSQDRSLDEFLSNESKTGDITEETAIEGSEDGERRDVTEAGHHRSDPHDSAAATSPEAQTEDAGPQNRTSLSTLAWIASGASCASCGQTVARRWRDGDHLVCPDCKDW